MNLRVALTLAVILPVARAASAAPATGRYVRCSIDSFNAILTLNEVEVFERGVNVATEGVARQSSTDCEGVASRAVDGVVGNHYLDKTMTHTSQSRPFEKPWWELDLKSEREIESINIWNRPEMPERLNKLRVQVLDGKRIVRWSGCLEKAGKSKNSFKVEADKGGRDVGLPFAPLGTKEELKKHFLNCPQQVGATKLERMKWFNPVALKRAIGAYADKYREIYADREALIKAVDEIAAGTDRDVCAGKLEKLVRDVYLRHPAVDFDRFLMVRRHKVSPSGLPNNWQGNSSIPLHGYLNDIVSVPVLQSSDAEVRTIVSSESFLGDVDIDFDADRISYSGGRENESGWRIFETRLDSPGRQSQLSPEDQHDIDFYDPCYLPDGRMLFVATSGFHGVPCVSGSDFVGNIHMRERNGTVRRLVFDQDNSWCPVVMNNGRVLYLRWEYADSAHYFSRVMMTMNPDGSDQKSFYGSNSYWPNSLFYARPLPGSVTKFCGIVSGHHGLRRQGELVVFDVTKGRRETEGVVQRIPGYGKSVENITKDKLVDDSRPLFLHPYPLSGEIFLVAVHRNPQEPFMIALADVYDNIIPLWSLDNVDLIEPVPIKARKKPRLPADRRDDSKDTCLVYLQGAHLGEGLKGVPEGTAKKLRLFQFSYSPRHKGGHYVTGFEGPWDPRTLIGEVSLEDDGSCLFTAPANTPIAIQPVDEKGRKLQEMRSWFVGVPGERLSCIGCHENQNEASPPTASKAMRKPPQKPKGWYGPRRNFSFEREVQPVLDARCVGCHNAAASAKNAIGQKVPDFDGRREKGFSRAYVNLMPYVRRNGPEGDYHLLTPLEFHVDTSELIQRLEKGHHGVKLTHEEMDRLTTWIDLNVPFWGSWSDRYPTDKNMLHCLARRKEMAEKWAGDTYDPERIVKNYVPGSAKFQPPDREPEPSSPPAVSDWPFDASVARAKQGDKPFVTLYIGGGEKLTLARIPAGSFVMGSNELTPAERPVRRATVDRPFLMGVTEITLRQMRLMDSAFENGVYDMHYKDQVKRGYFMDNEDFPAIRVSWSQAQAFCEWLSKKTGRTVRLPTETEWEWACRAGTATPMNYGGWDDDFSARENLADYMLIELAVKGVNPVPIARGCDPNPKRLPDPLWDYELRDRRFNDGVLHLAEVGSYASNAWGLKDMHGNVAEWTSSSWEKGTDLKVVRGGSWYRRQMLAASAARWRYPAWMRPFDVGFRVVVEE